MTFPNVKNDVGQNKVRVLRRRLMPTFGFWVVGVFLVFFGV